MNLKQNKTKNMQHVYVYAPEKMLMRRLQNVSHDCMEKNQKREDPISRRSRRQLVAWRATSRNRDLSKRGTPRACVLNGALRARDDDAIVCFVVHERRCGNQNQNESVVIGNWGSDGNFIL